MTAPARSLPPWARTVLRWGPFVLVLGGCAYLARDVDPHAFLSSLLGVRLWPLGLALVLAALGVSFHAGYWWVHLRTGYEISLRRIVVYTFASSAANTFLPVRGGEALRVWLVHRRHSVPLTMSGAIIAVEKVSDVTSLLLVASPLRWLLPDVPPSVARALWVLPCLVLAAAVAVLVAARFAPKWKLLSGFRIVERPSVLVSGFGCIFTAWITDVCAIMCVLYAVGVPPTLDKALLVILSVNLAIAIPSTPGQIGTHELGSTLALKMAAVDDAKAITFALLYHATQLLPILAIGLATARTLTREVDAADRTAPSA